MGRAKERWEEKKRNAEKRFIPGGTAGLWPREEQYSNLLITKLLFNLLPQTSGIGMTV